jgi:adenylylsulfate kinase-like enzyme/SAM-dependent methyltransferase
MEITSCSGADAKSRGGVIWITGLSASGKTTVGRKVKSQLDERGDSTIFLDGDDLRSIFGGKWGYDRDSRLELARIYFRMCNHLSSQGYTVIICAVAMYREIEQWVDENITNAMKVLLRVPQVEREKRDRATKNVYAKLNSSSAQYEELLSPHVVSDNYGSVTPEDVATAIVKQYVASRGQFADKGRTKHWAEYYKQKMFAADIQQPSPFAEFVASQLSRANCTILELGCGNGRDAKYFARSHNVIAIDRSREAVEAAKATGAQSVQFVAGSLPEISESLVETIDVVYSRFVLHAMTLEEEVAALASAHAVLKRGGEAWIECRSINDPLAREGEVISPTERIHGHYRRFIVLEELNARLLAAGFTVESAVESSGLARFGTEDPVVIRIKAVKS